MWEQGPARAPQRPILELGPAEQGIVRGIGRRHNSTPAMQPALMASLSQTSAGRTGSPRGNTSRGLCGGTRDLGHPMHAASTRSIPRMAAVVSHRARSSEAGPRRPCWRSFVARRGGGAALQGPCGHRTMPGVTGEGVPEMRRCWWSTTDPRMALATDLARRWPALATLQNRENLGFAGGMNTGLRWALERSYSSITILNNDTVVPPGTVSMLSARAQRGIAVSPEVRYADGTEQVWFGGGVVDRAHLPGATPGALRASRAG